MLFKYRDVYIVRNLIFVINNLVKDWNEVVFEFFLYDVIGDGLCINVENGIVFF